MKTKAILVCTLMSLTGLTLLSSRLCAQSIFDIAKDGTPQQMKDAIAKSWNVNEHETIKGETVLMWAAQFNPNPEMTTVILKAGAKTEDRDWDAEAYAWTALMWAAASNTNPEVLSVLLKAGAKVNAVDKDGFTPLIIAAENNDNPKVITALINGGASVNAKDNNGFTALMQAASKSHNPEVVLILLKAGADATLENNKGYAALEYHS